MRPSHTLYRFFASDGALLYVGKTKNPGRRLGEHRKDKPWWTSVARVDMEHFPTPAALDDAERRAIKDERPLHNVTHNNGGSPQPRPLSRCGLEVGSVYALALDGGDCPVGMVTRLDGEGVALTLFDWLSGAFIGRDVWAPYCDIRRWVRADVERLSPGHRASDGFYYASEIKELFLMEPLAAFQTRWTSGDGAL